MENDLQQKFISLLQTLFYQDEPSLDFGIYRIMLHKREEIRTFIETEFPAILHRHVESLESDSSVSEAFQSQVYNHLIRFFSRYYHQGDFIPQRRFGRKHKYVIPYHGEEIYFYWVNQDQYVIKSSPFFSTYRFHIGSTTISFHIVRAETAKGNIKSSRKLYFFPAVPSWEIQPNGVRFFFEFRSPLSHEKEALEEKLSQQALNRQLLKRFGRALHEKSPEEIKLTEEHLSEIARHLSRFTRRNERDYFIHKDLAGFLENELDVYIKTEVFGFDNMQHLNDQQCRRQLAQAKAVADIAQRVIHLLGQIENFQKRIWEKRSFVLQTRYVIALDTIRIHGGEELWKWVIERLLDRPEQLEEWRNLFNFDPPNVNRETLEIFLRQPKWQHLPLDTRYFDNRFKNKLLEGLTVEHSLDELLDGVLLHSENWTALNTISAKFSGKIKTIYIDPPFNKEQEADYLYKVGYKDSTWNTMLENRIRIARALLRSDGCMFVRCDVNGNMYVRLLMDKIFGKENFRNEIIINRTLAKQIVDSQFTIKTESLFLYGQSGQFKPFSVERPISPKWYPLLHFPRKDERPRVILGKVYYPPKNRRWALSQERIDRLASRGKIRINPGRHYVDCHGNTVEGMPELLYDSEVVGNEWLDIPGYAQRHHFATENAEALLKRVIESTTSPGEWVMDFFLGSGTTIAMAHKMKRKWVGIEMGEHFYTVILPRMKKVLMGDPGKISREVEWPGGGFFKYQSLEQFEDALENIEFRDAPTHVKEMDDYLIRYSLDVETRDSPTFLQVTRFQNPFGFYVTVYHPAEASQVPVDLVDSFHYWCGVQVEKVLFREHQSRSYVLVLGNMNGESSLIIWRPVENLDFDTEKEWLETIIAQYHPRKVYINGDCALTDVLSIEEEMKARLEGVAAVRNS